ncbi:MAG: hypothetical protein JW709_11755 [Sedimentisphaerales bacterium]|nr:hypothetical protein [Sedimentisphaerales bacterium]
MNSKKQKLTAMAIGFFLVFAGHGRSQEQPIKSTVTPPPRLTLQQKKNIIIEKNIFRPARQPSAATGKQANEFTVQETTPKPLKRPFVVQGIVHSETNVWADLRFESPGENRRVRVGDTIESITITGISPSYLACNYAGKQIWLAVGETSNDALAQAQGFHREYDLIATTIQGELRFATIRLRGEDRIRRISEGDILSDATVIRIEPGRVYLRYEDGFEHYIEPTGQPTGP